MARNGSGVYSLPAGYLATDGQTATAAQHNDPLEDLQTDMNVARPVVAGGTGATTAADARINLGLVIGTDVQAYDAGLASIAGLTTAADRMIYTTGADAYAVATLTAAGRAILDDADAAAQRTTLGLVIGTDVQAYDADILKADVHATLTAGYDSDAEALGTVTSGTITPEVDANTKENFKTLTANGAFTLAPPSTSSNCTIVIQVTNGASAGAITTSGFTFVTGDTYETTSGNDYLFFVYKVGSFSMLNIVALQ